ncbi:cytochrome c [Aestuariivirga sp.]|uniref:c-type cytochrome n=1 Tax=Aestuariivirga sp. TaxID=2650926 RepID=UPI0035947022
MIRKYLLMGLVVGGVFVAAPGALANSATSAAPSIREGISLELGQRDFRNYCAACHGMSGTGDGAMGEFLTLAVPDLTKLTKLNAGQFPEDRVKQVIDGRVDVRVHGERDMPVWGDWFNAEAISVENDRDTREMIVRERIESLVGFIKSMQVN